MRGRWIGIAAVLALMAAACGGGDDDGSADGSSDTQAPATTTTSQPAGNGSAGGSSGESGGNYAIVTVGSTTYEIPANSLNLCNNLGNLIFASFAVDAGGTVVAAGGTDVGVQINFGIPVPEWEAEGLQPPTIDVDDRATSVRWWASVPRGLGSVDSWTLEDGKAVGEATFVGEEIGTTNQVGTESGTFEVMCQ